MANDDNKETRVGRFKRSLSRITEQSTEAVAKAAKRADEAVTRGAERAGVSDQLSTARETVKRSAEAVTTRAEQAGVPDQLNTARETVKRSAEVMSGSDIRRLDEFTDAVTRVLMGLYRENQEQAERITRLEQTVSELQQQLNEEVK